MALWSECALTRAPRHAVRSFHGISPDQRLTSRKQNRCLSITNNYFHRLRCKMLASKPLTMRMRAPSAQSTPRPFGLQPVRAASVYRSQDPVSAVAQRETKGVSAGGP